MSVKRWSWRGKSKLLLLGLYFQSLGMGSVILEFVLRAWHGVFGTLQCGLDQCIGRILALASQNTTCMSSSQFKWNGALYYTLYVDYCQGIVESISKHQINKTKQE